MKTRLLAPFLLLAAFLFSPRPARAAHFVFDFDSLVYYSSSIVEAELVAREGDNPSAANPPVEARITKVLSGPLKEKEILTIGNFAEYVKPVENNFRTLAPGDRVVLFISITETPIAGYPNARDIKLDGVKLITDSGVATFRPAGRGELTAELVREDKKPLPTLDEFRTAVSDSLRYAQEIRPKLQQAAASKNPDLILNFLKARIARKAGKHDWGVDTFLDKIDDHLVEIADPALADQASAIEGYRDRYLNYSFSTVRGHAYLLARLADPKLSDEARNRYAQLVASANPRLLSSNALPTPPSHAEDYVRQLAVILVDPATDPLLRDTLLQSMNWDIDKPSSETTADLRAAAAVLQKFHAQTTDEPLLFTLECAIHNFDPAAYAALKSPCGPVISLITPSNAPARKILPKDFAVVRFDFAYRSTLPDPAASFQIKIVLQPTLPGPSVELTPKTRKFSSTASGTDQIQLPTTLPHGHYRIFARFYLDNKPLAESHFFDADL